MKHKSQFRAIAELASQKRVSGVNPLDAWPDVPESGMKVCPKCAGHGFDLVQSRCGVWFACEVCDGKGTVKA